MRRLLPALLIFAAIGPLPGAVMRFPVANEEQAVVAHPLSHPREVKGLLRYIRGWALTSPNSHFGGFSALARIAPGRFQLVGDNGYWTRMTIADDGGVSDHRIERLPNPRNFPARKAYSDVEAMFFDPQTGKSWLALEGLNQVWRLDPAMHRVESRRRLAMSRRWPSNSGAEAMVRLADGRTVIFSEAAKYDPRGTEALLYDGDPAAPGKAPLRFFYDAAGKGRISDAAPLPDGRILLVHRRLGVTPLFTTTIAIADPATIRADGVLRSQMIGRVPFALRDNFEGAAVAVDRGRTYLWLVSDNNFNRWQRNLLLQFELVDLPPRPVPSDSAQQKGGAVSGPP